jgi:hypothetical protein
VDFSRVDFIIEFKKVSDDPFVDDTSESDGDGHNNPFLRKDGSVHKVLGRITAYATAILSTQYRTHLFMVLIVGEYARLIRWDRGGAVVTKRICFNDEPHLFDFLIRYDIASPKNRGHDSTISPPSEDEIKRAKDIVPEFTDAEGYLAVTMSHQGTKRRFIIPRPEVRPLVHRLRC